MDHPVVKRQHSIQMVEDVRARRPDRHVLAWGFREEKMTIAYGFFKKGN